MSTYAEPVRSRRKYARQRWFEDFCEGEVFYLPSRTQSDALFYAFQLASGDNHPIHYDRPYCQALGHKDMLAHAMQVLIQCAPGAGEFPFLCEDSLIGIVGLSAEFKAPVYAGDTCYPALTVTALETNRSTGVVVTEMTVHNQDDVLCMRGDIRTLLRRREPAS